MQLSADESKFLSAIKHACQLELKSNKVLASVTAAQAIHESNFGKKNYVPDTNNLFRILVDTDWNGQCYSIEKRQLYVSLEDADSTDTLIKVYNSYDQCIHDWISYVLSARKSKNGPFKYKQVVGIKDYTKCIKAYIRCGYMKDHLVGYNDPSYESTMISFIENYNLYEWDKEVFDGTIASTKYDVKKNADDAEVLLSTPVLENAQFMAKNNQGYKIFNGDTVVEDPWEVDDSSILYRVRLSWDKPESQLLTTKSSTDAIEEALKHPGYKVYKGDNGELYKDPWCMVDEQNDQEDSDIKIVDIDILQVGKPVVLNNTPVYKTASVANPFIFLSGTFYLYDAKNINGRTRISKTNDLSIINGKQLSAITGFIAI